MRTAPWIWEILPTHQTTISFLRSTPPWNCSQSQRPSPMLPLQLLLLHRHCLHLSQLWPPLTCSRQIRAKSLSNSGPPPTCPLLMQARLFRILPLHLILIWILSRNRTHGLMWLRNQHRLNHLHLLSSPARLHHLLPQYKQVYLVRLMMNIWIFRSRQWCNLLRPPSRQEQAPSRSPLHSSRLSLSATLHQARLAQLYQV